MGRTPRANRPARRRWLKPFRACSGIALLVRREDTAPYEMRWVDRFKAVPMAVVLPENETQLVAVLKVCHALGVPVIARGAGTDCRAARCPTDSGSPCRLPSSIEF